MPTMWRSTDALVQLNAIAPRLAVLHPSFHSAPSSTTRNTHATEHAQQRMSCAARAGRARNERLPNRRFKGTDQMAARFNKPYNSYVTIRTTPFAMPGALPR